MSLNPFRSFGSRSAALATAAVVGAYALGSFSSAAAQTSMSKATLAGTSACTEFQKKPGNFRAEVQCLIDGIDADIAASKERTNQSIQRTNQSELRTKNSQLREEQMDREITESKVRTKCMEFLTVGITSKVYSPEAVRTALGGKPIAEGACGALRQLTKS